MDGYPDWELAIIVVAIAIPIAAVATERSDRRMKRLPFFGRAVAAWIAGAVLTQLGEYAVVTMAADTAMAVIGGCMLAILVMAAAVFRWAAQRSRDATAKKTMAYFMVVPLLGQLVMLALFLMPSHKYGAAAGEAQPAA